VVFAGRPGDCALGGAAVVMRAGRDGRCTGAAIALLAAGARPVRAMAAEQSLLGERLDEAAIKGAAHAAVEGLHPTSDLHGSSDYRVRLLETMTERALTKAAQRARPAA
jgi:carbon-monoxide dehydrogenase medium subunit